MEIILLNDYEGLGKAGDLVNVKSGFARNMLIPKGIALRASTQNIAAMEEKKKLIEKNNIRESASKEALIKQLSKTEITVEVQVGEDDKVFGSITSNDIHKSLEEKGLIIDKTAILLDSPLKSLGIFHVNIYLSEDYQCDIKVYVIKA
tara:strand:+ start:342 stop:785 length:444 start_codon:yes stop_codon:yes gene_type:complete